MLTLRGAIVRDPHGWAGYLTESIDLFGDDVQVAFASHHWPTWGNERVVQFLSEQRDLYAYLHDQTLRLLNKRFTGPEIAEQIVLPPALENAWNIARLRRLGQPQRQGDLPALPGLVRRQPGLTGGSPRWSTTSCSPTPTTPVPENCWPTSTNFAIVTP